MTTIQKRRLQELEAIVERGQQTFIEVGLALSEIRDSRLYLDTHKSFDAYCKERWGWTRQRSHQLIEAANVVNELPRNLSTTVDTEGAAREVAKLPPPVRAEVVARAAEQGKVTAPAIRRNTPPPPTRPPGPPPTRRPGPPERPKLLDKIGREIPPELHALWNRSDEVSQQLQVLSRLKKQLNDANEAADLLYVECSVSGVVANITQAYASLKTAVPYTVCPVCQGKLRNDCRLCRGRGLISKFRWDNMVPTEQKELILKTVEQP